MGTNTKMPNGLIFRTYQATNSAEVYGWLETNESRMVGGSGGWWRTQDPIEAAKSAAARISLGWYGVQS